LALAGLAAIPTKGFLLEFKRRVEIIEEGYRLLEMKRDELTRKLKEFLEELRAERRRVVEDAEKVLEKFREVYAELGPEVVRSYAALNKGALEVEVLPLSVMGVHVPVVRIVGEPEVKDKFNPLLMSVVGGLEELMRDLIRITELETKIEVIARDLERTNRIVNALERIIIPELKETIRYIEDMLEEEALEEFTRIKFVRDLIARRREEGTAL